MKIYILSPHIDDAAFCLSLNISRFVASNVPVTLINCFTVSAFTTINCGVKGKDAVSILRKDEDVSFNQIFNSAINIINLDLLDAPLRNKYIHQFHQFNSTELDIIEEIRSFLAANAGGLIFCPLALGNHIDHTICIEAVAKIYPNKQVIFYEDLPYTSRVTQDEVDDHIKNLEGKLNVKLESFIGGLANSKIDKEQAIRVYKSQVNDEICSEIITYMNHLGGERLWGEAEIIKQLKEALA
ncbi:PIG-L deacetylase family protein [Mucilaginibacter arboris]|uniref:PIG-L deacetylase family protein n=1 Tax=Mucilaginibacter arboris TaxID=2682090 RepID=UPI0018DB9DDF|nr:PIG-L family deacetylase [Mucilaginibacter arboris]